MPPRIDADGNFARSAQARNIRPRSKRASIRSSAGQSDHAFIAGKCPFYLRSLKHQYNMSCELLAERKAL